MLKTREFIPFNSFYFSDQCLDWNERLDFCNSLGIEISKSVSELVRLRKYEKAKHEHITTVLKTFHWLINYQNRVKFKTCNLVHKALRSNYSFRLSFFRNHTYQYWYMQNRTMEIVDLGDLFLLKISALIFKQWYSFDAFHSTN